MKNTDSTQPTTVISVSGNDYEAFLAIDSITNETSSGGVRISDDIRLEEICTLAREMTYKYSLFRLPRGGAKMGIRLSDELAADERERALREIGHKLGPIIRQGIYYPGMDMNCGPAELRAIYAGAGFDIGEPTDTSLFTALGVENAIEACYEQSGATGVLTIAIEGFGRVAGHLAQRLAPERYRIVALSTLCGAVKNSNGFEGRELAAQRGKAGDRVVQRIDGEQMPIKDVLIESVDVLLPSTRTWVITPAVADRIQAKTIIPIANAPYAEGVAARLHERGVLCLPGYLVNGGGVFGSTMFDLGMSEAEVERTTRDAYRPMVGRLVQRAESLGVSPVEVAEALATQELEARNKRRPSSGRLVKLVQMAARRLPKRFHAKKARRQFIENMASLTRELENTTL